MLGMGACTRQALPLASPSVLCQTPEVPLRGSDAIPKIPNRPEVVTVIPFYMKSNPSWEEQTKVVLPADVDGVHGRFILDLGSPQLYLNRTFLQPSRTGGVDTVTPATQRPEKGGVAPASWDSVHVRLRLGTLVDDFDDPSMGGANPRHVNAVLNHHWGNFQNFAPRLGNLSLSALEPFETIIDYTRRRVVLIRLDSAGHRLVDVPAYTPVWTAPLIDIDLAAVAGPRWAGQKEWGVHVQLDGGRDSVFFDTGSPINLLSSATLAHGTLRPADPTVSAALVIAGRSFPKTVFYPNPAVNILGYDFLHRCGVVGFNYRTHQFILYRT